MSIDAIHAMANMVKPAQQIEATPQHINKFTQMLNSPAMEEMIKPPTTPEQGLVSQFVLAKAAVKVDLTAKTAGVFGQSINKLANMQ